MGKIPIFIENQINTLHRNNIDSREIEFRGSNITFLQPIESIKVFIKFYTKIKKTKGDLIHAHWGSLLGFAAALCKNKNTPLVVTFRGSDVNRVRGESVVKYYAKKVFNRYSASRADHIICVSKDLSKQLEIIDRNFSIIPDGVDLGIFKPQDRDVARKNLGWEKNRKYILFHRGLRPKEQN